MNKEREELINKQKAELEIITTTPNAILKQEAWEHNVEKNLNEMRILKL
jgi:hypothetical protein